MARQKMTEEYDKYTLLLPKEATVRIEEVCKKLGKKKSEFMRDLVLRHLTSYINDPGAFGGRHALTLDLPSELFAGLSAAAELWELSLSGLAQLIIKEDLPVRIQRGRDMETSLRNEMHNLEEAKRRKK